ncbi:uncharacterized protein BYT42DRAFT_614933 [Radiomyces spectabilis]|uniref:uncharacterized protein n=1 Tax=Radiomyces spectabilis TaxID=64574 RepID=UPI002220458A|nr:uncharacterized protein BYT42DRAFT_614933 [Radiomyces spectabilis]KAI8376152.1 hypothetical protein BYT42DRAFT_614933 [Radiomyces spectabilis]
MHPDTLDLSFMNLNKTSMYDYTSIPYPSVHAKEPAPQPLSDTTHPQRKRTRATPEQLAVLENAFSVNPSPNNRVRVQLSRQLGMSERTIQIWFQNRRAKMKNMAKRSAVFHDQTLRMQQLAAAAATAACQANAFQQQQTSPNGTVTPNPDLYYYYYYYYYNQQQQQQQQQQAQYGRGLLPSGPPPTTASLDNSIPPLLFQALPPPPPPPLSLALGPSSSSSSSSMGPVPMSSDSTSSQSSYQWTPPPPPLTAVNLAPSMSTPTNNGRLLHGYRSMGSHDGRLRAHSVGPYPSYSSLYRKQNSQHERHASVDPSAYHRVHRSYTMASPAPPTDSGHALLLSNKQIATENTHLRIDTTLGNMNMHYNSTGMDTSHTLTSTGLSTCTWPEEYPEYPPSLALATPLSAENTVCTLYPLSTEALQIGTWRRMNLDSQDLMCFYDGQQRAFVWSIHDGHQKFKMKIGLQAIQGLELHPVVDQPGYVRLVVQVWQPEAIEYYMEDNSDVWIQCQDYTQDIQASLVYEHHLEGSANALRADMIRLAMHEPVIQSMFLDTTLIPTHEDGQVSTSHQVSSNPSGQELAHSAEDQGQQGLLLVQGMSPQG